MAEFTSHLDIGALRSPDIMADAAYVIFTSDAKAVTGNFLSTMRCCLPTAWLISAATIRRASQTSISGLIYRVFARSPRRANDVSSIFARRGGAFDALATARLRLGYAVFGYQFAGARNQARRERIIHAEQAQTYTRETFLVLDNISGLGERRQFNDNVFRFPFKFKADRKLGGVDKIIDA
jgi:hypothetical protein